MEETGGFARRVLLVEDDPSNALTLAALLEDIGVVVDTAGSVAAARAELGCRRYALLLLDHHLGDGVSTELLPLIEGLHPRPPAVLLTGANDLAELRPGFAAVHVKGTDPEEILTTVRRLLAPPQLPP